MEDKTVTRIGIVASIIGAVGTLAFLLRGSQPGPAGAIGATGAAGSPGITGAVGVAGAAGGAGAPGTAGAAGGAGAPGTAGAAGVAATNTVPGADTSGTPGMQSITQYFVNMFYPPASGQIRPSTLTYNAPPGTDLGKRYMGIAADNHKPAGGCGCGGKKKSGGCGGKSKCPNAAPPFQFTDGAGGCLSSTYGSLIQSMETCLPGFAEAAIKNMASATMYYGYDTAPPVDNTIAQIQYANSRSGILHDFMDAPPPPLSLGTA